jgi:hypothetical protein
MTRARAFVAAVPQRVWTAVAGLALLASLAIAAVIGAGLQVWRSAVGSTAQVPPATVEPPGSGLVVVPGGSAPRPPVGPHPVPVAPPVAAPPAPSTGSGPANPASVSVPAGVGQPGPPAADGDDTGGPNRPRLLITTGQPDGFLSRGLVIRLAGEEFRVPMPMTLINRERGKATGDEHRWAHANGEHRRHVEHANHVSHARTVTHAERGARRLARHAHHHGRHR